ncbi:MAG: hypothetical protein ACFCD0_26340 [Gemmataceae bacterium]
MRKQVVLALTVVVLAIGPGGWVRAQEGTKSAKTANPSSWFGRLNPFQRDKSKTSENSEAVKKQPKGKEMTPEMRRTMFAGIVEARERKAWERRVACCMKIREIAEQLGDTKLLQRVEMLDQRAWRIYMERTSNIPVGSPPSGSNSPPRNGESGWPASFTDGDHSSPAGTKRR